MTYQSWLDLLLLAARCVISNKVFCFLNYIINRRSAHVESITICMVSICVIYEDHNYCIGVDAVSFIRIIQSACSVQGKQSSRGRLEQTWIYFDHRSSNKDEVASLPAEPILRETIKLCGSIFDIPRLSFAVHDYHDQHLSKLSTCCIRPNQSVNMIDIRTCSIQIRMPSGPYERKLHKPHLRTSQPWPIPLAQPSPLSPT